LSSYKTDSEYFEAIEALVWLSTEESDFYFEALGFDPIASRKRLDLSLYAEFSLLWCDGHQELMFNMYIAMGQYSLKQMEKMKGRVVPYEQLVKFTEDAVLRTKRVLNVLIEQKTLSGEKVALPTLLEILGKLSEDDLQRIA
jgi:hypothetical protein